MVKVACFPSKHPLSDHRVRSCLLYKYSQPALPAPLSCFWAVHICSWEWQADSIEVKAIYMYIWLTQFTPNPAKPRNGKRGRKMEFFGGQKAESNVGNHHRSWCSLEYKNRCWQRWSQANCASWPWWPLAFPMLSDHHNCRRCHCWRCPLRWI